MYNTELYYSKKVFCSCEPLFIINKQWSNWCMNFVSEREWCTFDFMCKKTPKNPNFRIVDGNKCIYVINYLNKQQQHVASFDEDPSDKSQLYAIRYECIQNRFSRCLNKIKQTINEKKMMHNKKCIKCIERKHWIDCVCERSAFVSKNKCWVCWKVLLMDTVHPRTSFH